MTGRSIAGGFQWDAFLYGDNTGMKDLGTLGGSQSRGQDINADGDVVGWAETTPKAIHAFLCTTATGMVDLTAAIDSLPAGFVGRVGQAGSTAIKPSADNWLLIPGMALPKRSC